MPVDPHLRSQLGKETRLWLLSAICAAAGATAVYLSGSLLSGVMVFLLTLMVLGMALMAYEKRHKQ